MAVSLASRSVALRVSPNSTRLAARRLATDRSQENLMRHTTPLLLLSVTATLATGAITAQSGLRGDPAAIADARAMVETMGGAAVWRDLGSLHFVHEWFPWDRSDSYVENEILDMTGPRSSADRRSEVRHDVRVYSPENGRWTMRNGEFARGTREQLDADLARAPFNFYRLVKGVAADDPFYEVRFGQGDIPGTRRLEFRGPDGSLGGWVILNTRKEPIVKATPIYRYTLGPLKRFGNLRIPAWGVYDNGYTRYQMISLAGDREPPPRATFQPPTGVIGTGP